MSREEVVEYPRGFKLTLLNARPNPWTERVNVPNTVEIRGAAQSWYLQLNQALINDALFVEGCSRSKPAGQWEGRFRSLHPRR